MMLVALLLGAFAWTFLEYVIHRWMGHDRRFHRTPFGREHIRHHIQGDYFAPTSKKLAAAVLAAAVLIGPAIQVAGLVWGGAYVAGLISCYGLYELLHRREHTHPGRGWYGRWARRHHFHHHFVDGRSNHGVTTPLWDLVFGTYRPPSTIKDPPQLAMKWLLDPATGEIRPEHRATYTLRGPAPRAELG
jgi:sterol desaturase/sphingolipid hydroxylase (fatty acid hydroxylase superfamily)